MSRQAFLCARFGGGWMVPHLRVCSAAGEGWLLIHSTWTALASLLRLSVGLSASSVHGWEGDALGLIPGSHICSDHATHRDPVVDVRR